MRKWKVRGDGAPSLSYTIMHECYAEYLISKLEAVAVGRYLRAKCYGAVSLFSRHDSNGFDDSVQHDLLSGFNHCMLRSRLSLRVLTSMRAIA